MQKSSTTTISKGMQRFLLTLAGLITGAVLFEWLFYKPGRSGLFDLEIMILFNIVAMVLFFIIIFSIFKFVFKGSFKLNGFVIGLLFALFYSGQCNFAGRFLAYIGIEKATFLEVFIVMPLVAFILTKIVDATIGKLCTQS